MSTETLEVHKIRLEAEEFRIKSVKEAVENVRKQMYKERKRILREALVEISTLVTKASIFDLIFKRSKIVSEIELVKHILKQENEETEKKRDRTNSETTSTV